MTTRLFRHDSGTQSAFSVHSNQTLNSMLKCQDLTDVHSRLFGPYKQVKPNSADYHFEVFDEPTFLLAKPSFVNPQEEKIQAPTPSAELNDTLQETADKSDKSEKSVVHEVEKHEEEEEKCDDVEEEDDEKDPEYKQGPKVDTKNLFGILRDRVIKLILSIIEEKKLPKVVAKDGKKQLKGLNKRIYDTIFNQDPIILANFGKFLYDYCMDKEEYKQYEKCNKNPKWKKLLKDLELDSTSFYNLMKRYFENVEPKDWIEELSQANHKEVMNSLQTLLETDDKPNSNRKFFNWKNNKSRVKLVEFCTLPGFGDGSLVFYKLTKVFMEQDDIASQDVSDHRMKDNITKRLLCPQFKRNFKEHIIRECDAQLKKSKIV